MNKEYNDFFQKTQNLATTVSYSLHGERMPRSCYTCNKMLLPKEEYQCDECLLKDITDIKNAPRHIRRKKKERRGMPTKGHAKSDVFKGGSGRW